MTDTIDNQAAELPAATKAPRSKKTKAVQEAPANPESSSATDTRPEMTNPPRKPVMHSQPVFEQTLQIHSLQGQRVMDRSFRALSGSLFRCEVILRIVGDEQAIDLVESQIMEGFQALLTDLEHELAGAKALMQTHGIEALPTYTNTKKYKIKIKTPQIANFARMVVQLDELISRIDALWILGQVITSKDRSVQTWDWQQRLIKLANRIIHLERRARESAYRKGMRAEVEAVAPESQLENDERLLTQDDDSLEDTSHSETESAQPA